jgi:hypothetical protein
MPTASTTNTKAKPRLNQPRTKSPTDSPEEAINYVGKQVDAIIAYDDASTDRTLEILRSHPKVVLIVTNGLWEEDVEARRMAEGRHRGLLLQIARARLQFDWMFCFDADERVIGDLRGLIRGSRTEKCDGVRIQLFDAYMTPDDCAPYHPDHDLLGLSSMRSNLRESQAGWNECGPISTASTMVNHCRSSIGKRPATITSAIFRSIPMDENGLNAKVGQSILNLISCGVDPDPTTRRSARTGIREKLFPGGRSHPR